MLVDFTSIPHRVVSYFDDHSGDKVNISFDGAIFELSIRTHLDKQLNEHFVYEQCDLNNGDRLYSAFEALMYKHEAVMGDLEKGAEV